jgi:hypothetical protein
MEPFLTPSDGQQRAASVRSSTNGLYFSMFASGRIIPTEPVGSPLVSFYRQPGNTRSDLRRPISVNDEPFLGSQNAHVEFRQWRRALEVEAFIVEKIGEPRVTPHVAYALHRLSRRSECEAEIERLRADTIGLGYLFRDDRAFRYVCVVFG